MEASEVAESGDDARRGFPSGLVSSETSVSERFPIRSKYPSVMVRLSCPFSSALDANF
jgi:hypothetical protein